MGRGRQSYGHKRDVFDGAITGRSGKVLELGSWVAVREAREGKAG